MKRSVVVIVVAIVVLVIGALIAGSSRLVQAECRVCVEFRGQTQCRRGSGTNDEEARRAAQRAACAVMATSMDASIACDRTRPKSVQCPGPSAP